MNNYVWVVNLSSKDFPPFVASSKAIAIDYMKRKRLKGDLVRYEINKEIYKDYTPEHYHYKIDRI